MSKVALWEGQLRQYRIIKPHDDIPSRRHFEARLYTGVSHFAIAPFLGANSFTVQFYLTNIKHIVFNPPPALRHFKLTR